MEPCVFSRLNVDVTGLVGFVISMYAFVDDTSSLSSVTQRSAVSAFSFVALNYRTV